MCNQIEIFNRYKPYVQGKSIEKIFPDYYMGIFKFAIKPPGYCGGCGRQMAYEALFPPDRLTPRSLCQDCWEQLAIMFPNICWVCQRHLDEEQQDSQKINPYDIQTRIHQTGYMLEEQNRPCSDYFAAVSAHVLGIRTGLFESEKWWNGNIAVPIHDLHTEIVN
jgi:hypothetical protein